MKITSPAANGERKTRRLSLATRVGVLVVSIAATMVLPARSASAEASFNQRILELVNRDRVANGVAPVVADPALGAVAEDKPVEACGMTVLGRAKDMGVRNYFDHKILGCGLLGVTTLLNTLGINLSGSGENIAWMNGTTDPVVAANNLHSQWMGSDSHRKNILNPLWTRIGVGSWSTSPGQTWSGGGYTLSNVWIGVQLFTGGTVTTTTTSTTVAPTTTPPAVTGRYTPLTPARILDTRDGTGGLGVLSSGGTADMQVTGRGGVPTTDVAAVAMTVTVTQPSAAGYLTMYPAGVALPLAANLNFAPGQTVSNLVVVKVGANGRVSIYNPAGTTHVIADVAGWYSASDTGNAGRYESVVPSRILDTRSGLGDSVRVGPGASIDLQVTGRGGVPASGVQAATVNVAVTGATAPSYLTVHPAGEARPNAATAVFGAGTTVSIRTIVKLGAGGKVTIYNAAGSTEVIVDVVGWYSDASTAGTLGALVPVAPARILDTRDGTGGVTGAVPAGGSVDVQVTGRGGVPSSGVRAVVLNATVTSTTAAGYLTIFPAGTTRALVSDLNFDAGVTHPNLVVAQVGAGGKVTLYAAAGTHVIFDVAGWIS